MCAELASRGLRDVLIVACDGLTGFPEAIAATLLGALVQTCVIHLIQALMQFVSHTDRKAVAAGLRPTYTAVGEETALQALEDFADSELRECLGPVHLVPRVRNGFDTTHPVESPAPAATRPSRLQRHVPQQLGIGAEAAATGDSSQRWPVTRQLRLIVTLG